MQSGKIDKEPKTIFFCRTGARTGSRLARLRRARAKHRIEEPEELFHPAARDQEDEILARMEARGRPRSSDGSNGSNKKEGA
jgi:hypothetical protein